MTEKVKRVCLRKNAKFIPCRQHTPCRRRREIGFGTRMQQNYHEKNPKDNGWQRAHTDLQAGQGVQRRRVCSAESTAF